MTQILISDHSEVNAPSWSYDTLKPPKISIYNLFKDIRWHIKLYNEANLPLKTKIQFICLRIVQRISYNKGWEKGGKNVKK